MHFLNADESPDVRNLALSEGQHHDVHKRLVFYQIKASFLANHFLDLPKQTRQVIQAKSSVFSLESWMLKLLQIEWLIVDAICFHLDSVVQIGWLEFKVLFIHDEVGGPDELLHVIKNGLDILIFLRNCLNHPVIHQGINFRRVSADFFKYCQSPCLNQGHSV